MSTYYSDKPINKKEEDLLGRQSFSKLLAHTLMKFSGEETFAIGLLGKWGTGKTSIINMTLQEMEEQGLEQEKENIIIHFEPWNFSNSEQLLSQFFVRLSSEFKNNKNKNLKTIGKALEKYSESFEWANLIPEIGGLVATLGKFFFKLVGKKIQSHVNENDVVAQKKIIIDLLQKQTSKIIIIIDDIDRLSNDQIRQVFQLVSSVAKFPKTIYLLVFDKDVVVKALEDIQKGDGEEYLEKVIQMPIQIPEIPEEDLYRVLFAKLDKVLSSYPSIAFSPEHWNQIFPHCVSPYIKNLRDINRLCNILQFKLTTIYSEVDFADMIAISSVEIGNPTIYQWIREHKDILTGQSFDLSNKTQTEWKEFYKEMISKSYGDEEVDLVETMTMLSYLFPYFGNKIGEPYLVVDDKMFRKNNRITHADKFDRYFSYDIDSIVLRKAIIEEIVNSSPTDRIAMFLLECDEKKTSYVALQEIETYFNDILPNRVKILFEALIQVATRLEDVNHRSVFSLSASSYAQHMCLDLIGKIIEGERKECITEIINAAELETLNTIAVLINMIELGYGRLAANGKEREDKKVITLDELLEVEKSFTNRVKKILAKENLFNVKDWRMIFTLLKAFEPKYIESYLCGALKDNKNVLRLLWISVSIWTGSGTSYEIHKDYEDYVSEERVLSAIKEEVKTKEIFNLEEKVIQRSAAFYLNSLGQTGFDDDISQEDVDKIITKWKESGIE